MGNNESTLSNPGGVSIPFYDETSSKQNSLMGNFASYKLMKDTYQLEEKIGEGGFAVVYR